MKFAKTFRSYQLDLWPHKINNNAAKDKPGTLTIPHLSLHTHTHPTHHVPWVCGAHMSHSDLCSVPAGIFLSCSAASWSALHYLPWRFRGGKCNEGQQTFGKDSSTVLTAAVHNMWALLLLNDFALCTARLLSIQGLLRHAVCAMDSWTPVLCALHVNMIRSTHSPCVAPSVLLFHVCQTLHRPKMMTWWNVKSCCSTESKISVRTLWCKAPLY